MGKKILIDVTERGRNGGKARAARLTDKQRSAAARKAVNARWAKVRVDRAAKAKRAANRKIQKLKAVAGGQASRS